MDGDVGQGQSCVREPAVGGIATLFSTSLERQAKDIWENAQDDELRSEELERFKTLLESLTTDLTSAVEADDVEWFIIFAKTLSEIEDAGEPQDFPYSLPYSDWGLGSSHKVRDLGEGLEAVGAVRGPMISSGSLHLQMVDLRVARQQIERQVIRRLRDMGLDPTNRQRYKIIKALKEEFGAVVLKEGARAAIWVFVGYGLGQLLAS